MLLDWQLLLGRNSRHLVLDVRPPERLDVSGQIIRLGGTVGRQNFLDFVLHPIHFYHHPGRAGTLNYEIKGFELNHYTFQCLPRIVIFVISICNRRGVDESEREENNPDKIRTRFHY